jgi:endonuclease/exonuclease/phosphatase family metal-dependent hydrolase
VTAAVSASSTEVRVLSYNVRSLRDDADAVARVIRACAPDIACIQEAPRFFRWRSRCAWLARRSGLLVVTGGRTAAGNLLLAHQRARVREADDVLFPWTPGKHRRGMATAVVDVGAARLAVASLHMSLYADERSKHLGYALDRLGQLAAPNLVVAGDINESPVAGAVWPALASAYRDAYAVAPDGREFTYSSSHPRDRIDGIFVSSGVEVIGCGVPDLPELAAASDHLPVVAALRVPALEGQPNKTSASA